MKKIKYGAITTVESNMRSFVLPLVKELKENDIDAVMMCNMSRNFLEQYSDTYHCCPIDIERGFHPFNLLKTILQMYKVFRIYKFDIVQYGTENAAFCASIASWLARIPVRVYEHWGARYVGFSGTMRLVSKVIEKTAAFFSTDIRQVSNGNMEMCIADRIYKREKVKVLGLGGTVGVDFSLFDVDTKEQYRRIVSQKYNLPNNAKIMGFVGRIQTDKGVNELISAFRKLHDTDKNVYLLLIGSIDDANPIDEEKMEWAKGCPNIIFVGFVSDVYKYMSAFDLLVHPTYREGFGMVLQEAAALKVPILTTDINGPGEYILNGTTGVLVPAKDAEALYVAMQELVYDEGKRSQLAENNFQYTLEYFERSVMVDRIIEDRKELLEKVGITWH